MPTEVVTKVVAGRRVPRAILPRRIDRVADDVDTIAVHRADVDRPGTLLERAFAAGRHRPQRLIVTGARGSGKSLWCAAVAEAARARGMRVVGVSSPAVIEGGRKVAIDLVDVRTGQRRRLADVRRADEPGTATQRWRFDETALAWGNGVLRDAAQQADADLLMVDELGPLEFVRGEGFTEGLAAIDAGHYAVACAVVRPALVDEALRRWPDATVVDVED
jgi:nucleoside-triphosphatase